MPNKTDNPIASAIEKIFAPLVELSGKLPAPLAYGLASLVALIVAFVVTVPFGAVIPDNLLWFILAIDLTALLAFVFVDWQNRQTPKEKSSISHILESTVFYVVVHEEGDQTALISDAEVTLALPEPVTKKTGSNGAANFTIPNDLVGKEFFLNARKVDYRSSQPVNVVLRRQGYQFLPLQREDTAPSQPSFVHLSITEQSPKPIDGVLHKLVYDSRNEEDSFISWTLFSSAGAFSKHISIVRRDSDGSSAFRLSATSTEAVGVNKSFRALHGRVEFEYKVESSHSEGLNIFFYMIPMQETGIGRTGLIEVGTNAQDDPRNAFSPYRVRFLVPAKHYGDGQWHSGSIDFDFRDAPEAFYSIFGPRVNEGSVHPGVGVLLLTNIRLYSNES